MYHEDGIQVWVEPLSSDDTAARYEELQLSPENNLGGRYWQCLIPVTAQSCKIVFKFLPNFDMHNASMVYVALAQANAVRMDYRVIPANRVDDRAYFYPLKTLRIPQKENHRIVDQLANNFHYSEAEYDKQVRPGCIAIMFQRGDPEWVDEEDAAANIICYRGPKQNCKPFTFERSLGPHGKKYIFEFCPQNRATINETRKKIVRQSQDSRALEATHDGVALSMQRSSAKPDASVLSAQGTEQHAHRRTTNGVKKVPKVCNCSESHEKSTSLAASSRSRAKLGHSGTLANGGGPGSGQGASDNSDGGLNHSTPPATSAHDRADGQVQDVVALKCSTCKKVIKAPRGKKLVYSIARSSWVYGGLNARGDDPPDSEVNIENDVEAAVRTQGGATGSDDDEEAPPVKPDRKDQTVEQSSDARKDRHSSVETVVPQPEDNVESQEIHGDSQPAKPPASAVTNDNTQRLSDQNNNGKRQASSPARGYDSKRPCVEIDLTLDDDDDAIIKQEPGQRMKASSQSVRPEQMDVDALRHEITSIELEAQMLKLEQRKLVCQRELQKKQLQRGSLAKPLKIEEGN